MATTEQLMAQYGVAWFDFDEPNGNVYDKLGLNNYVGTVTGATRTLGWNRTGNALNFSGNNQYVNFNNSIIPQQEKTIKFKIKTGVNTSYSSWILSNTSSSSVIGATIRLTTDGRIYTTVFNSATVFIMAESSNRIDDNKWHDIMISYGQFIEIYIDNVLDSRTANTLNASVSNSILRLGVNTNSTTAQYLNGQIDDLQIYNKALSPSDFIQKRLAIKSTDNKNLVLSPAKTKEIPNVAEDTLLNQGVVIKEIDSAVDRPPLDLTATVNKYEVANNIFSPSGMNKIFTIPLEKQFKTIEIEDNY